MYGFARNYYICHVRVAHDDDDDDDDDDDEQRLGYMHVYKGCIYKPTVDKN